MDIIEAIESRKSIRAYTSRSVDREVVKKILEVACRAPSAMNTQPWEFIVVTGDKLNQIRTEAIKKLSSMEQMAPEHHVVSWGKESVYRERQVELAKSIFKIMDIEREDKEKRMKWLERGFRFFDAPVAIILLTDRSLSESGPLLDVGAVMQNICLAALKYGLGTCIEDQGVLYPDIARSVCDIPDTKKIIISIALGYPDNNFPANQLHSERENSDNLTKWVGFG